MSTRQPTEGNTFAAHAVPAEVIDMEDDIQTATKISGGAVMEMEVPGTMEMRAGGLDAAVFTAVKHLVENGLNGEAWSRARLAKALGISPATVSIYLSQDQANPPALKANLAKLEGQLADLLATLHAKRQFDGTLFETVVSRKMNQWIGMVRSTGTIGLYLGEAGVGKSCGLEMYRRENPTGLTIAAKPWKKTRDAVVQMLWEQFDTRGWDRQTRRAAWIAKRLTGMETVLLVDDSHTLTFSALEYLIYLSEETSTPLVLVGNPKVLDKLRQDAQLFSRAFLKQEGKLTAGSSLNAAVDGVLQREAPEHVETLRHMARQVAAQPGHLRGLTQRCRAMRELMSQTTEYAGDAERAFAAAHALSIHSGYALNRN